MRHKFFPLFLPNQFCGFFFTNFFETTFYGLNILLCVVLHSKYPAWFNYSWIISIFFYKLLTFPKVCNFMTNFSFHGSTWSTKLSYQWLCIICHSFIRPYIQLTFCVQNVIYSLLSSIISVSDNLSTSHFTKVLYS